MDFDWTTIDPSCIAKVWREQGCENRPVPPPLSLISKVTPYVEDTDGERYHGFIPFKGCTLALQWTRDDIAWARVRLHGSFQLYILDILLSQQRRLEIASESFHQQRTTNRLLMHTEDLTHDRRLVFIDRSRDDGKQKFSCENLNYSFDDAIKIKSGVTIGHLFTVNPPFLDVQLKNTDPLEMTQINIFFSSITKAILEGRSIDIENQLCRKPVYFAKYFGYYEEIIEELLTKQYNNGGINSDKLGLIVIYIARFFSLFSIFSFHKPLHRLGHWIRFSRIRAKYFRTESDEEYTLIESADGNNDIRSKDTEISRSPNLIPTFRASDFAWTRHQCRQCYRDTKKNTACKQCKATFYCSYECQVTDEYDHHYECETHSVKKQKIK